MRGVDDRRGGTSVKLSTMAYGCGSAGEALIREFLVWACGYVVGWLSVVTWNIRVLYGVG
jgi:hypothetical protein